MSAVLSARKDSRNSDWAFKQWFLTHEEVTLNRTQAFIDSVKRIDQTRLNAKAEALQVIDHTWLELNLLLNEQLRKDIDDSTTTLFEVLSDSLYTNQQIKRIEYGLRLNDNELALQYLNQIEVAESEAYYKAMLQLHLNNLETQDTAIDQLSAAQIGEYLNALSLINKGIGSEATEIIALNGLNTAYFGPYSLEEQSALKRATIKGSFVENISDLSLKKPNDIAVFPNPSYGSLTINGPFLIESISVNDLSGRIIPYQVLTKAENEWLISVNYSGLIVLEVTSSGNQLSKRFKVLIER